MKRFRPMLGEAVTAAQLPQLRYPLLVSPKYDGIRALVMPGARLVSRKLKPIKNLELRALYGIARLVGHDGELVLGSPTAPDCYHRTQKIVNTAGADATGVKFCVFDTFLHHDWPYVDRHQAIHRLSGVQVVPQFKARSPEEVLDRERFYAERGWEGVMLRAYAGHYKHGRSTLGEGLLLKLKRSQDSEARVLDVHERKRNANKQQRDERGYAKRSSAKAGKRATGLLGGFRCRDLKSGVEFDCGTGVLKRHELKLEGWVGHIIKYRFQPVGVKDKPRYPRYIGCRTRSDM